MPTTKTRINLSVTSELNTLLEHIALRDQVSVAAKALDLVRIALEIEEDVALFQIVHTRAKGKQIFVSHEALWG